MGIESGTIERPSNVGRPTSKNIQSSDNKRNVAKTPTERSLPKEQDISQPPDVKPSITLQKPLDSKYTVNERAFMALHDLTTQEFEQVSKNSNFEEADDVPSMNVKTLKSEDKSDAVNKVKTSLKAMDDYTSAFNEKAETILSAAGDSQKKLDLLSTPFAFTLETFKVINSDAKTYTDILEKYGISDPLKAGRDVLDQMTLLEETNFNYYTNALKAMAMANMTADELEQYFNLTSETNSKVSQSAKEAVLGSNKEFAKIEDRMSKATNILAEQTGSKPVESPVLYPAAQELAEKIVETGKRVAKLDPAKDAFEIDKLKADKEGLKSRINDEIEIEYFDAFAKEPAYRLNELPVDPKAAKQFALMNLLNVAAQLGTSSEKTILYSRLMSPKLSNDERNTILEIYKLNKKDQFQFKGDLAIPLMGRITATQYVSTYPEPLKTILTKYAAAVGREVDANSDVSRSGVGRGYTKGNAMFYALEAAGIPEKELSAIGCLVEYDGISPALKEKLSTQFGDRAALVLKELKELRASANPDNWKMLSDEEKSQINKDWGYLMDLNGLIAGSSSVASVRLSAVDGRSSGSIIRSQLDHAEGTPEPFDDVKMHETIRTAFRNGIEGIGLSAIDILTSHITAKKTLNEPIDKDFVSDVLNSSTFQSFSNDGRYKIDELKANIIDCLSYMQLEGDSKDKTNLERSKTAIKDWIGNFIDKEISDKIKAEPRYAGSSEIFEKMMALGAVCSLLSGTAILSEEEMKGINLKHPIIPVSEGLTVKSLEKEVIAHSIGFENLPEEIREQIMKDPDSMEFCRQNADLLNVYWVPQEESNNIYSGFATYDKNTIFVNYQTPDGNPAPASTISSTLLHELQHKVDNRVMNQYFVQHLDFLFDKVPILITERNARLRQLDYLHSLDLTNTPEEEKKLVIDVAAQRQNEFDTAESLLNNPSIKGKYLEPPFAEVDINSYAMYIYPPAFSADKRRGISDLLDKMCYSAEEKQWLTERIIGCLDKLPIDLRTISTDRRDLFVDFLGRIIDMSIGSSPEKSVMSETKGLYGTIFHDILRNLKEAVKTGTKDALDKIKLAEDQKDLKGEAKEQLKVAKQQYSRLLDELNSMPVEVISKEFLARFLSGSVQAK
ncbi:MAG: hypothetical protein WC527_04495 [Candidatus Margulisiibacteriota bacterium]